MTMEVLALIPLLVTDRGLWALGAVSLLAPCWWFTSGVTDEVLADFLVLTGYGVLIVWTAANSRVGAVTRQLYRLTMYRLTI